MSTLINELIKQIELQLGCVIPTVKVFSSDALGVCYRGDIIVGLSLYGLHLKNCPVEIGALTDLESLSLKHNNFTQLPECLRSLRKLNELYLAENQLKELPAWIVTLSNLHYLTICDNFLTSLPSSLVKLSSLEILSVKNNPIMIDSQLQRTLEANGCYIVTE